LVEVAYKTCLGTKTSAPLLAAFDSGVASVMSSLSDSDDVDGGGLFEKQRATLAHPSNGTLPSPTKRAKLRGLGHKAKEKTKHLLSVSDTKSLGDEEEVAQTIRGDPAFNPGYLRDKAKKSKRRSALNAAASLGSLAKSAVHPVDAIKGKAVRTTASKLSQVQRPFLSKDADLEFLEAHDELDRAESSRASRQVASDDDDQDSLVEGHRHRVEQLKAQRESLRVAWTTTRFVTRVRVVPKRHFDYPKRQAFVKAVEERRTWARYDWLKWMGHVLRQLLLGKLS